jgi:hypothetical protein
LSDGLQAVESHYDDLAKDKNYSSFGGVIGEGKKTLSQWREAINNGRSFSDVEINDIYQPYKKVMDAVADQFRVAQGKAWEEAEKRDVESEKNHPPPSTPPSSPSVTVSQPYYYYPPSYYYPPPQPRSSWLQRTKQKLKERWWIN